MSKHRRGALTAEHITHLRDAFTKACGEFNATLDERNRGETTTHIC